MSITLRPRSIASMWVRSGSSWASGLVRGSSSITPSTPFLPIRIACGADLQRPQRGGRVGGEERVAGTGREDHDPALLEVPDRPPPDVRLGHLGDVDRRHHPGVGAQLLQRVLDCQRVQHGREHAGVVGGRAVHALARPPVCRAGCCRRRRRWPARPPTADTSCTALAMAADPVGILTVIAIAHQGLARELQQDPAKLGHPAPTSNRAKRLISMFSPIVPDSSARSVSIVLPSSSGRIDGWLPST